MARLQERISQQQTLTFKNPFASAGAKPDRGKMKRPNFRKIASIVSIFFAATVIAVSAQTFTTLAAFHGTNGQSPNTALVQGLDGNLYGTTGTGGTAGYGTFYKITPAGKLTTIYSFCSLANCDDGAGPNHLLLAADGNFYGVTGAGGANCKDLASTGCGTFFKITSGGTLTTLYNFCSQASCADGWDPSTLVQGRDGNFYGTTGFGGIGSPDGFGIVFKVTVGGVLTVLHDFCSDIVGGNCADGNLAESLMLASNGNFYGIADEGGSNDCGEVFEITPTGTLITFHSFTVSQGCSNSSGLTQASDGNFYGTTNEGGAHGKGLVYKLTLSGTFTPLYAFCALANCADGNNPTAGVVQGTDGNFYGTTHGENRGAQSTDGTVFQLTPTGTLTTLHTFDSSDGAWPQAPMMQATNGNFYGTTSIGAAGDGTIFSVSMGLAPFVAANPNFGAAGRVVNILGNNLTGTTSVTFNGTPATFAVISSTLIKAQVPTGATTGTITVTTPGATLSGNTSFQVLP
jgi:uncharacterized repeat protein (TIGR03803 family)